jgi:hypothetical protein
VLLAYKCQKSDCKKSGCRIESARKFMQLEVEAWHAYIQV